MVSLTIRPYFSYENRSTDVKQEVRGSIPGLAATISEICYLLLPSRAMTEKSTWILKTTNQQQKSYEDVYMHLQQWHHFE